MFHHCSQWVVRRHMELKHKTNTQDYAAPVQSTTWQINLHPGHVHPVHHGQVVHQQPG